MDVISETSNETYSKPLNLKQWFDKSEGNIFTTIFITNIQALFHLC